MNKKYICIGGDIISKNDGDRHFIPASYLPSLYGVPRGECYFVHDRSAFDHSTLKRNDEGFIILTPDPSGEYKLPEAEDV